MATTVDYFSDLEGFGVGPPLPTPTDTPYHTPRPSISRRSSRRRMVSRGGSSSPPPLPTSSSPPHPASSPITQPGDEFKSNEDVANDESISILDPRRFTPTLHASLVSEILTLRREMESKHQFIEELEANLASTKSEKDELNEKLANSERERRLLKRQFQQLEHGTLSALEELAKDRDSAKELNVELRDKLDAAQKRIRTHEEDTERLHSLWDKDRRAWDTEKLGLERRVYISETRLKTVLEGLAAQQEAAELHHNGVPADEDDNTKDSGVGEDASDTASIRSAQVNGSPRRRHTRNFSRSSQRSLKGYRISTQSLMGHDGLKLNGISLADELQLDEEDEDYMDIGEDDDDYLEHEARARRALESRQSYHHDEKAKRLLGLITLGSGNELGPVRPTARALHFDNDRMFGSAIPRVHYIDTGVQFSPPPSPVLVGTPDAEVTRSERGTQTLSDDLDWTRQPMKAPLLIDRGSQMSPIPEPVLVDRGQQMSPIPEKSVPLMISASAQTVRSPLSPPQTPKLSPPPSPVETFETLPPVPTIPTLSERSVPTLVSASTQTEPPEQKPSLASSNRAPPPAPLPIPSIVIDPPLSSPPSPREPLLPPGTKSAGCQTPSDLVPTRSVCVQTEEIRFNKMLLTKLPLHLRPSSISSNPPTPEPGKRRSVSDRVPLKSPMTSLADRATGSTDRPVQKKVSIRLFQRSPSPLADDNPSSPPALPSPVEDRYPGNNDNGPLADNGSRETSAPRRPFRDSSLFAGFDQDETTPAAFEQPRADQQEEEQRQSAFQTPAMPPRLLKHTRHFGNRPSPVPEDKEVESKPRPTEPQSAQAESSSSYSQSASGSGRPSLDGRPSFERGKQPLRSGANSRQNMRRSAMIQNGATAHAYRSRTPSIVSVGSSAYSNTSAGPPFPVPDRASSRKLFSQSKSEGSQSPTPRSGGIFGTRKQARPLQRKDSLRKVRSATTIQRSSSKGRQRSRSPPLEQRSNSPVFPPLPKDNIAIPQKEYPSQREARKDSTGRDSSTGNADVSRASQGGVVDAIASCMVGEWMYKYVRRRKPFGVQESPQDPIGRPGTDGSMNVTGNGARHKRWVWLSPYERAVMWSSKQPVSNSALLGKSGRKLVIQSVLDVRDDTPLPKNHGIAEPFNRSILILTPARALKFTAMSRERHYTWLTALSFLAHSPLLAPGLADMPQPPQEPEVETHARAPSLRRAQIRDSVRIAKDKARPQPGRKLNGQLNGVLEAKSSADFNRSVSAGNVGMMGATGGLLRDDTPISDSAEAPSIPRFSHGRKRSLTGPSGRFPPALRNLAYTQVPTPNFSPPPGPPSEHYYYGVSSARTSEASSSARRNFFDAVGSASGSASGTGTVRMEAFIEGSEDGFTNDAATSSSAGAMSVFGLRRGGWRRNSGWSGSNLSAGGSDARRSGIVYPDDFDAFDPFRGF